MAEHRTLRLPCEVQAGGIDVVVRLDLIHNGLDVVEVSVGTVVP